MVKYDVFSVSKKYHGLQYNRAWGHDVYAYTMTLKNTVTGAKTTFKYFEGIAHTPDGDNELNALYCFLTDATAFINARDFADFCADFGYNYDATARKAYKGCESAYNRLIRVTGFNDNELYSFIDKFVEDNPDVV